MRKIPPTRNDALRLSNDQLEALINEGESCRVEFQSSMEGAAKERAREAVCAFSNDLAGTGEPGVVFVGLQDDGSPSGLRVSDALLRSLADMKTDGNILPPPTLLVESRRLRGAEMAVVTVLPSTSPPVRCRSSIHVRNGPRRSIATAQEEHMLSERRRRLAETFDLHPVAGTSIADINRSFVEGEYLPQLVSRDVLQASERTYEQRLASAKLISSATDVEATVAGLLVAGIRTRDFIPGAAIQFLRLDGSDLADGVIDSADIEGSVPDLLRGIRAKLDSHNRRKLGFTKQHEERFTEIFPIGALIEIIHNAVMHREYQGTNAPVRVLWFSDRIEILSPGGAYGSVTRENFASPGNVDYRNPNLAEAMKAMGFVQKFGIGIPMANRMLRDAGHPEVDFTIEPTTILATIHASRTDSTGNRAALG